MKTLICYGNGGKEKFRIGLKQNAISYLVNFLKDNFSFHKKAKRFLSNLLKADEICICEENDCCSVELWEKNKLIFLKTYSNESLFSSIYKNLSKKADNLIVISMLSWEGKQILEFEVSRIDLKKVLRLIKRKARKVKPEKELIKKLKIATNISLKLDSKEKYELSLKINDKMESIFIGLYTAEILWTFLRCLEWDDKDATYV